MSQVKSSVFLLMAVLWIGSLCQAQNSGDRWYDHAAIYEIYPRSFQDTNGDGIGDLNGITARLDYLKQLGIDAIWITPFFPSPNFDFGYDVSDYVNVAPEYGTLKDWDRLVAEAKKRGIRILIDFVLNHTSDQHPWFKESRASRTNPKRDWYVWRSGGGPSQPPTHWTSIFGGYTWTWDAPTQQWYYHVFLPQQPDVNWRNPELRKAMYGVVRFWLDHGASGFRLDATPYLFEDPVFPEDPNPPQAGGAAALEPYNSGRPENHQVLREMRKILDGYPGNPVLLGESSTATIQDLARVYGEHHDLAQRGCVLLYYGEEIGMGTMPAAQLKQVPTGPKRPRADDRDGERTPMQWNSEVNAGFSKGSPWLPVESGAQRYNFESEKGNPDSIFVWYSNVLKLRHENTAFRDGAYIPLESGNRDVFAFGRNAGEKNIALIVLNTSPKEQRVSITGMPGKWPAFREVLMASPSTSVPPSQTFAIAPYGVLIAATE